MNVEHLHKIAGAYFGNNSGPVKAGVVYQNIDAPFKANISAQARPIPCPAPVINAMWPLSSIDFRS